MPLRTRCGFFSRACFARAFVSPAESVMAVRPPKIESSQKCCRRKLLLRLTTKGNAPICTFMPGLLRPSPRCQHIHEDPAKLTRENIFQRGDRKSTRLNSSHVAISYAVFCLKK